MNNSFSTTSISELSHLMKQKEIKVIEVVRDMLQAIEEKNAHFNAFISLNADAEDIARRMDRELALGKDMGPLFGIPIGVKDMIDTRDMRTTMGSEIYANNKPEEDAEVVKRLKKAGALIIGKTNTHQFAYGPTGDRSYFGPMRNPYDTTKMAGGSSGGSAASVAAGLCSAALGTDTSGSIRVPAAFCGLVGMKPTNGKVPVEGVYPLSGTLDCVGPMTRTVDDNRVMMQVLTDETSYPRYTQYMAKGKSNLSIGIPHPFFLENVSHEIAMNFREVKDDLEQIGITIQDVHIPDMDIILEAQKTIIAYESYQIHKRNLLDFPDLWDPEVKERLEKSIRSKEQYHRALKIQQESKYIFENAMKGIDALLTPTSSIVTPDINQRVLNHVNSDGVDTKVDVRSSITRLTAPTNISGLPSMTMPSGLSDSGMPLGVQLIGKSNEENTLYQIGYLLESECGYM